MVDKEFIVTGHLKDSIGAEKQTYILHNSFFVRSKEQAITAFHDFFEPELEVIKIFSVIDSSGNIL